jgi:hypothetical protein
MRVLSALLLALCSAACVSALGGRGKPAPVLAKAPVVKPKAQVRYLGSNHPRPAPKPECDETRYPKPSLDGSSRIGRKGLRVVTEND